MPNDYPTIADDQIGLCFTFYILFAHVHTHTYTHMARMWWVYVDARSASAFIISPISLLFTISTFYIILYSYYFYMIACYLRHSLRTFRRIIHPFPLLFLLIWLHRSPLVPRSNIGDITKEREPWNILLSILPSVISLIMSTPP